jgi:hypothetical protein
MPRRLPSPVDRAPVQIDLFPEPLHVEAMDPKRVGGARTRVLGVYLVRRGASTPTHRVFHDRHGWYCEQHGRECRAVRVARETQPA